MPHPSQIKLDRYNEMLCDHCDGWGAIVDLCFGVEFTKSATVCQKCKGTGKVKRPVVNRLKTNS